MIKKYHTKSAHNVVTTKGQARHCVLIKHSTHIQFCKQLSFIDHRHFKIIHKNGLKSFLNLMLLIRTKTLWYRDRV